MVERVEYGVRGENVDCGVRGEKVGSGAWGFRRDLRIECDT